MAWAFGKLNLFMMLKVKYKKIKVAYGLSILTYTDGLVRSFLTCLFKDQLKCLKLFSKNILLFDSYSFNFNVEVEVRWKKTLCLGYFRMLFQGADINPRAPLAGSVTCLGNSNRAFGVLFGSGSHHKGPNNRVDAHCVPFLPAGDLRPLWWLPGLNKTPNARLELPVNKIELTRRMRGFTSASWGSMRKYLEHRDFFTRPKLQRWSWRCKRSNKKIMY